MKIGGLPAVRESAIYYGVGMSSGNLLVAYVFKKKKKIQMQISNEPVMNDLTQLMPVYKHCTYLLHHIPTTVSFTMTFFKQNPS